MHLHHLAFRSSDIEALASFYRELFGWPEVRDLRPRAVWLAISENAVAMIESREAGEAPPSAQGLDLVALAANAREKDEFERRAREIGCFDGRTEHTVYIRDPEGRRLALSSYPL